MMVNDDPKAWALIAILLVLSSVFGIKLIKSPERFVVILGRKLRAYAEMRDLTDEQLERMVLPGAKSFYNDNMKDFVNWAETQPERFTRILSYVQGFGYMIITMIGVGLFLLLALSLLAYLSPYTSICFTSQPGCP